MLLSQGACCLKGPWGTSLLMWLVMLMLTLGAWPVHLAEKMSSSTPAISTNDVLRSMPEPPERPVKLWPTSKSA